jgi:hypothetical protein
MPSGLAPGDYGDRCTVTSDCCSPAQCYKASFCCTGFQTGESCTNDNDCCSGVCNQVYFTCY